MYLNGSANTDHRRRCCPILPIQIERNCLIKKNSERLAKLEIKKVVQNIKKYQCSMREIVFPDLCF